MKKLFGLLSIISLLTVAVACNQNRQDEEVRGMETTEERMEGSDGSLRTDDIQSEDQRMEDSYQENYDQMNEDTRGSEGRVEEGVNP